jgi:hypothetical protein
MISKEMGRTHKSITRVIDGICDNRHIVPSKLRTYRGKIVDGYYLDKHGVEIFLRAVGKSKAKSTILYVIAMEGTDFIKIGIASNVKKRLKALQTGNPIKLNIEMSLRVDNANELEYELHRAFANSRVLGEWFKLDVGQVMKRIAVLLKDNK